MDRRAQPAGEERWQVRRADHKLLPAKEEPVALNPIESKWVHGKRRMVEADGLLGAHELAERVCFAFGCPHHEHRSLAEQVAWSCTRLLLCIFIQSPTSCDKVNSAGSGERCPVARHRSDLCRILDIDFREFTFFQALR